MPNDDQPGPQHRWLFSLGALTLLALCLRLPGLSASFYGDEGFSLLRDSDELLTSTEDRFRPVFFTLLFLWRQLGFHGEVGLRSLPLLFGVLQVPAACLLAERLAGRRAGVIFGLLIAVNPLLIEFSQELRMYSLVPLIALLQALAFVAVQQRYERDQAPLLGWLMFVLTGLLGVYSHFHYWLLMPGFALALVQLRQRVPLRHALAALGAMVLFYLPNVPSILRFQQEAAGAPHFLAKDIPSALPKLLVADTVGFNYFVLPELGIERAVRLSALAPNAALALLLVIPAGLVAYGLLGAVKDDALRPLLRLGNYLFTVPALVALFALVVLGKNFIHPKYMVFSAPFFVLLLSCGVLGLSGLWLRTALAATSLGVVLVALLHAHDTRSYGRREDWRGVAAHLRSKLDGGSVLLWLAMNEVRPAARSDRPESLWEYYAPDLQGHMRVIGPVAPDASPEAVEQQVRQLTAGARDVYYVWSEIARNVGDPQDKVLGAARRLFPGEDMQRFNPRLALFHFPIAPAPRAVR